MMSTEAPQDRNQAGARVSPGTSDHHGLIRPRAWLPIPSPGLLYVELLAPKKEVGDIGAFLYFSTQFLNVNLKLLQLLLIEVADSSEWFK